MKYIKLYEDVTEINSLKDLTKSMGSFTEQTPFHTKSGSWMGAPFDAQYFVELINKIKNLGIENFIELGSGNGSKSVYSSKFFKRVYGIEFYGPYAKKSSDKIKELGIMNVKIIHDNMFHDNLFDILPSGKSLVYSFLPFDDREKLNKMFQLYYNHVSEGSVFMFPGCNFTKLPDGVKEFTKIGGRYIVYSK